MSRRACEGVLLGSYFEAGYFAPLRWPYSGHAGSFAMYSWPRKHELEREREREREVGLTSHSTRSLKGHGRHAGGGRGRRSEREPKGHRHWRGHQAKGPIITAIVHAHPQLQQSGATALSSGVIFDVISIILVTPTATCLPGRAAGTDALDQGQHGKRSGTTHPPPSFSSLLARPSFRRAVLTRHASLRPRAAAPLCASPLDCPRTCGHSSRAHRASGRSH